MKMDIPKICEETLQDKLELLIKKRRELGSSCIRNEQSDILRNKHLGNVQGELPKFHQVIHTNSLHSSLVVDMESGQKLNGLPVEMVDSDASLNRLKPIRTDLLDERVKEEKQFSQQITHKTLVFEQRCLNITKFMEDLRAIKSLTGNSHGTSSQQLSSSLSDNLSIMTIHGEDIQACSSVIE